MYDDTDIEAKSNNDNPGNKFQCHHIFPDGFRCGSPRMRGEQFCYYHHDSRRVIARPHERIARRSTFSLITPTSGDALQESLAEVLIRIAANDIDPRRAGLLLYGLQIATTHLRTAQKATSAQASPQSPDHGDTETSLAEAPISPSSD